MVLVPRARVFARPLQQLEVAAPGGNLTEPFPFKPRDHVAESLACQAERHDVPVFAICALGGEIPSRPSGSAKRNRAQLSECWGVRADHIALCAALRISGAVHSAVQLNRFSAHGITEDLREVPLKK